MDEELKDKYISAARAMYADPSDDDIEIDDNPILSESVDGEGCWVQAWVWVRRDDVQDDPGKEEEDMSS